MGAMTEIRQGLADALAAGVDLDWQVSAYILGDPTPPCAEVLPDETDYHRAMSDGSEEWGYVVQVKVGLTTDIGAQQALDEMLETTGSTSVKAALEAAGQAGGAMLAAGLCAQNGVLVKRSSGYGTYTLGTTGAEVLGAQWFVTVTV
jgi:hypothetical protein